jgi:putative SOS response-associated peptidase YedK
MCGRFVSARKRLELLEEFAATRDAVKAEGERSPDYNVAPTRQIYAVTGGRPPDEESGKTGKSAKSAKTGEKTQAEEKAQAAEKADAPTERELHLVRWGLVPAWAKDAAGGSRLINARSETVAVKPSFRAAFARRRCLIPADGYYEWITEGKAKKPFYILREDKAVLPFAGLYELWRDKSVPEDHENAWYWSATIITTQATDEIGRIHDRTPMVIAPDDWADWLDPGNKDKDAMHAVMRPATASGFFGLTSYAVSADVNSVRNNRPSLIDPLAEGGPSIV